ncbi:MAG: NUDIX domain-containing protein [Dehalococcoidales bacterium]|nr:NUDIX domain-containing protein [Dehalococcoidales bacterium]
MERKQRISAAAIIIRDNKILLVRYNDQLGAAGATILAGPGGGVNGEEGLAGAVIREVKEETGLDIIPVKILCIEDFYTRRHRNVKVWFLCNITGGRLTRTPEAVKETIIGAGWFTREELERETVYPEIIKCSNWGDFISNEWQTKCTDIRYVDI